MIPAWVSRYVGLEYENHGRGPAFDCWGLVKHVLKVEFGLDSPDFGEYYRNSDDEVAVSAAFEVGTPTWTRVAAPQVGDVVVVSLAGRPTHCGLVVGPQCMLHIKKGTGSIIERYDRPNFARRIEGIYRHPSLLCT